MLNPALWLGFVIMLALAGFSGYRHGVKSTNDARDAQEKATMVAMIDRHNEMAKQDVDAVVTAEKRRQKWRLDNLEKRHVLEIEAALNHRPECSWSDRERWLLNDIINGANGEATPSGGLPDGVRPNATLDGNSGSGGQGLGWKGRVRLWRMSGETL